MRVKNIGELMGVKSKGLGINHNGILNGKTKVLASTSADAGLGQL